MWIVEAKEEEKESYPTLEAVSEQQQMSEAIDQAGDYFSKNLNTLRIQLEQAENNRFDPENPTGVISEELQNQLRQTFGQLQLGIGKVNEAVYITTHYHAEQKNPYIDLRDFLMATMKSVFTYIERIDQPIDQATTNHGIWDQQKSVEKMEEFIQKHHPQKPRPKPWPLWLKNQWKQEKPAHQFSGVGEMIRRLATTMDKIVKAPRPKLYFGYQVGIEESKEVHELIKSREKAAKDAFRKPVTKVELPSIVREFYPSGMTWFLDPDIPRDPDPHSEGKVEYSRAYQKPGWIPKHNIRNL